MIKVLVVGYFNKCNLGDDLFLYIWKSLLEHIDATFISFTELEIFNFSDIDIVILAGGNLLLDYFANEFLLKNYKKKLVGYSLAIPFKGFCITSELLDNMDFISCRSKKDTKLLNLGFKQNFAEWNPDISIYLPEIMEKFPLDYIPDLPINPEKFTVGVFLTRPIFKSKNYTQILNSIAKCLDIIVSGNIFQVFIIPFDTNEKSFVNNDVLINNDLYKLIQHKDSIHLINKKFSVPEMYHIFNSCLDINITMRFHSVMYSIITDTPCVPLFTTNKVKELIQDIDYPYSYPLDTDSDCLPISLDCQKLLNTFFSVWTNKTKCISTYKNLYKDSYSLDDFKIKLEKQLSSSSWESSKQKRIVSSTRIINTILNYISNEIDNRVVCSTSVLKDLKSNKKTFHDIVPQPIQKHKDNIASLVCFIICGNPNAKYHYGISEKIFSPNFNIVKDIEWIWNDFTKNQPLDILLKQQESSLSVPLSLPLFNMNLLWSSDMIGLHRSGWQYIVDSLWKNFHSLDSDLIFDNYIDRTFHWRHTIYKYTNVVPFTSKWCGFIHHTFESTFSNFNLNTLFENPDFLKSLPHCIGLFTFSKHLSGLVLKKLHILGFYGIKVESFIHPSEFPSITFSMGKFISNNDRKIINIGGWLRNTFSIYNLNPTSKFVHGYNHIQVCKSKLKGPNMDSYFPLQDLNTMLETIDNGLELTDSRFCNKFNLGLSNSIHHLTTSVEIIDTLDNKDYDDMLSKNIVFLDLIDASAVNTLIECIIRSTPILINPLPAIVELLGKDYPFYFNDITEANFKASHLPTIKKTFIYLQKINKNVFKIEYFTRRLQKYISQQI
jgi:polysaccharide pyruvyl transferase WcaK-like protein